MWCEVAKQDPRSSDKFKVFPTIPWNMLLPWATIPAKLYQFLSLWKTTLKSLLSTSKKSLDPDLSDHSYYHLSYQEINHVLISYDYYHWHVLFWTPSNPFPKCFWFTWHWRASKFWVLAILQFCCSWTSVLWCSGYPDRGQLLLG